MLTYVAMVSHRLIVPAGYKLTAFTKSWTSSGLQLELGPAVAAAVDNWAAFARAVAAEASLSASCLLFKAATYTKCMCVCGWGVRG